MFVISNLVSGHKNLLLKFSFVFVLLVLIIYVYSGVYGELHIACPSGTLCSFENTDSSVAKQLHGMEVRWKMLAYHNLRLSVLSKDTGHMVI